TVKIYEDPIPSSPKGAKQDYGAVLFDGNNIGTASDGTLRVTEISIRLISSFISCLLIEEPETAVHPGLLGKLLALTEPYSHRRSDGRPRTGKGAPVSPPDPAPERRADAAIDRREPKTALQHDRHPMSDAGTPRKSVQFAESAAGRALVDG